MGIAFFLRGEFVMRIYKILLAVVGFICCALTAPLYAWTSYLYPPNWTPDAPADGWGRFLHDFSYAGYHNSEVPIPFIAGPIFNIVTGYGADFTGVADCTTAIQNAIDDAATSGGGVVFFPNGIFRINGKLLIQDDNIVLRGTGPTTSRLHFTLADGTVSYDSHLKFQGDVQFGGDLLLTTDGVNRSHDVFIADASTLSIGQEVGVGWVITDPFIAEHNMTGTWVQFNGQWRPFFRRKITAIDTSGSPHKVTFDVPLRYPAKTRDSASIRPLMLSPVIHGYIRECGMEDLGVANAVTQAVAITLDQVHVVGFYEAEDCWVKNVRSFVSPLSNPAGSHLQSSGIIVQDSNRVTVTDCVMDRAQHRGGGGNGYLYEIMKSNEVLTRDCVGSRGRHNFIQNWDFGTTGCVWLRCNTSLATSDLGQLLKSEYHHSLAMACLVDSCIIDDGWQGGNRDSQSSGAGHTVTQSAYWNSTGSGDIGSWNFEWGYVIGTAPGITVTTGPFGFPGYQIGADPEDYREGIGTASTLTPSSLFEDQLYRRLTNSVKTAQWVQYE